MPDITEPQPSNVAQFTRGILLQNLAHNKTKYQVIPFNCNDAIATYFCNNNYYFHMMFIINQIEKTH
jgi:hypothetical protein